MLPSLSKIANYLLNFLIKGSLDVEWDKNATAHTSILSMASKMWWRLNLVIRLASPDGHNSPISSYKIGAGICLLVRFLETICWWKMYQSIVLFSFEGTHVSYDVICFLKWFSIFDKSLLCLLWSFVPKKCSIILGHVTI